MIPKVVVFASGDKQGGGSGFQEMVEYSRTRPAILNVQIIGVISNHENGGVRKKADKLGIPFFFWPGPYDAYGYKQILQANNLDADFYMYSGWLKKVVGLDPCRSVNIHPGWLSGTLIGPHFGGPGMYGHYVHEATIAAFHRGEVKQSAVTMHFVTESYDQGPIIFRYPILIRPEDTAETLANRVNQVERAWQSYVLNLVVNGKIWLSREQGFYVIRGASELEGILPGIELNVRRCQILC